MSIDPGVETGYCYAKITEEKRLAVFPTQGVDDVDDLWYRLTDYKPDIIVMEDWEDRRGARATGGVNTFPVQLIGVARFYTLYGDARVGLYLQKPSVGLGGFYSDNMLKQLGLYKRGFPHAMSAMKHLMTWAGFRAGSQYVSGTVRDFAFLVEERPA